MEVTRVKPSGSDMLFTSYKYGLALLIAFAVFWAVARFSRKRGPQNAALLLISYGFYAFWDWRWCGLLAGITATGYFGAIWLGRTEPQKRRRLILVLVLILNLGALGALKYFDFFSGSFAAMLGRFGLDADQATLNLVLPVGLSYYTFQNLSYVIDVYRREIGASRDALSFFTALSFFPQLLAGPITRPRSLLPQLGARREFDGHLASDGLRQFLWGLFKKMVIADGIGIQVDYIWANYHSLDGLSLMLGALLYSVQIYCDFSGYADMAIGSAKLFGLRLDKNFNYPYFSTSIREFWSRWHMSLSSWMRDYVYISLGGNRVGKARLAFNIMVTFLLVGLWHGSNWTFIVWGLLHGLYRLPSALLRKRAPKGDATLGNRRWSPLIGVGVFLLVTFAWVFFRAPSITEAAGYLARALSTPYEAVGYLRYVPWISLSAGLFLWEGFMRKHEHGLDIRNVPLPARWAGYVALCLALLIAGFFGNRAGIYVQF